MAINFNHTILSTVTPNSTRYSIEFGSGTCPTGLIPANKSPVKRTTTTVGAVSISGSERSSSGNYHACLWQRRLEPVSTRSRRPRCIDRKPISVRHLIKTATNGARVGPQAMLTAEKTSPPLARYAAGSISAGEIRVPRTAAPYRSAGRESIPLETDVVPNDPTGLNLRPVMELIFGRRPGARQQATHK